MRKRADRTAHNFQSTTTGGTDMADDRDRNQGMKQGDVGAGAGQQGGAHQAPARNPQEGQQAGRQGDQKQGGDFDPNKGGDGGSYKEGGQNEETRR
jgi:hypothetical protein